MAKKKQNIPAYGTAEINGVTYFRTRITDADGKRVPIYASTCEELFSPTGLIIGTAKEFLICFQTLSRTKVEL